MDKLEFLRNGGELSRKKQISLVLMLSFPAIMSMISTIIMEYIDASMVGSLGSDCSAAIGVVSTTTWLISGLCSSAGTGFTVGLAHRIGAGEEAEARKYVKTGFIVVVVFSSILMGLSLIIHRQLPAWMGADEKILDDATDYFMIFALSLPLMQINHTGAGMLECSGNMKLPALLNVGLCFLDVIFNSFFIYEAGMGVKGAALGTLCANAVGTISILLAVLVFSKKLHLRKDEHGLLDRDKVISAIKISLPVMVSSLIMGFAYVLSTKIVSPLGNIAITANSFSITAESLCYMPGYGISHAAVTLVGQMKGAGNKIQEKNFAYMTVIIGMVFMALSAVLLYIFAPEMIGIMSAEEEVRTLGTQILRIEAFAEPMFGASIVAEGVFRGMGKTRISTVLNLISMWCVRLPASLFAANQFGLVGVWVVMCLELCFRGTIFLVSMWREYNKIEDIPHLLA
ncbi:MAG: MATE family efflux transporter [Lachnospiraceae bacterium]|nr:MATE family efflux transporter [Lachnospiraceae bacterium]